MFKLFTNGLHKGEAGDIGSQGPGGMAGYPGKKGSTGPTGNPGPPGRKVQICGSDTYNLYIYRVTKVDLVYQVYLVALETRFDLFVFINFSKLIVFHRVL